MLSIVVLGFTAVAASAATVSYTVSFGPDATDYFTALSLPLFDPGTGGVPVGSTLTGASLELDVSEDTSSLSLANKASISEQFSFMAGSDVAASSDASEPSPGLDPLSDVVVTSFDTGLTKITLGSKTKPACPEATPSSSCSSVAYTPPDIIVTGTSSTAIDPTNLSAYVGPGNFNLDVQTSAITTFIGGGNNITLTEATTATVTGIVTYTYTPGTPPPPGTPEPGTLAMLGAGLVGLGAMGRKKFSH